MTALYPLMVALLPAAMDAWEAGFSVIPVGPDKKPVFSLMPMIWDEEEHRDKPSWEPYKNRLPTRDEVVHWFSPAIMRAHKVTAYAIVFGKVSGNAVGIDVDRDGHDDFETWYRSIGGAGLIPGARIDRTGKGKRAVIRLAPDVEARNERLAQYLSDELDKFGNPKPKVIFEIKGEGGYAIMAPSRYLDTDRFYEQESGDLKTTPIVSLNDWQFIRACAADLDEIPKDEPKFSSPPEPKRIDGGIPQQFRNRTGATINAFLNRCERSDWDGDYLSWARVAMYALSIEASFGNPGAFWQAFEQGSRLHPDYDPARDTKALRKLASRSPGHPTFWDGYPFTWNPAMRRVDLPPDWVFYVPVDSDPNDRDRGIWYSPEQYERTFGEKFDDTKQKTRLKEQARDQTMPTVVEGTNAETNPINDKELERVERLRLMKTIKPIDRNNMPYPSGGYDKEGIAHYDIQDAGEFWYIKYGDGWAYHGESWYQWTGKYWQEVNKTTALDIQAARVLRTLGILINSTTKLDSCTRIAASLCAMPIEDTPGLINFNNGTLDLRECKLEEAELYPHRQTDGLSYCLPFDYDPAAGWDHIKNFFDQSIPDPEGQRAYMAHLGLALMGDLDMHFGLIPYGPPRSGKSTLIQIANSICGHAPKSSAGSSIFDRETEGLRSRATWNRRGIVAIEELPAEALKNEELAKQMLAHDGVPMRGLYSREQTANQWRPKLIMATNDRPMYRDRSGALTRRLVVIECPNGRGPDDIDATLFKRELLPEIPGLAVACIKLGIKIKAKGSYPMSEAMRKLLEEIEAEGDPVKSFVRDCCVLGRGKEIIFNGLFAEYKAYCERNGYHSGGANMFSKNIRDRYLSIKAGRDARAQRVLYGIELKPHDDED